MTMHANLIAWAVAYAHPMMNRQPPVAQWGQTEWPHGTRNSFLARGPLRLRQHGLRLGVTDQHTVVIDPVPKPVGA